MEVAALAAALCREEQCGEVGDGKSGAPDGRVEPVSEQG
jgi:hypothetical protein